MVSKLVTGKNKNKINIYSFSNGLGIQKFGFGSTMELMGSSWRRIFFIICHFSKWGTSPKFRKIFKFAKKRTINLAQSWFKNPFFHCGYSNSKSDFYLFFNQPHIIFFIVLLKPLPIRVPKWRQVPKVIKYFN